MIAIENVLISDEVLESRFICALDQCKGACCYEGDFGAPVNEEEKEILDRIYPTIREFLPEESRKVIEQQGTSAWYREMRSWGTALMPDGACVFMTRDANGIAACGIEQAWKQGATDFQKPISCHLYPIRIKENKSQGFIAVNYDRWEICDPGCRLGASEKMPLFRFLKAALTRRFGADFYDQLEAAYEEFHANQNKSSKSD